MNIAVYSDKFSGTLSASEVIEIVKELFENNSIKASYFPVTDGGEDSSTIFKEHGIEVQETINVKDLVGVEKQIEVLNKIFSSSITSERLPMLVISKKLEHDNDAFNAQTAAILGFSLFSKKNFWDLISNG